MVGEKRQLLARLAQCTPVTCDYKVAELLEVFKLAVSIQLLPHQSTINQLCIDEASDSPKLGVWAYSEPLIPLHFLLTHASSHHIRLHFYQFLQDRQHRGPFQTSTTGPESLQMLEFLYFTCSYLEISSKP